MVLHPNQEELIAGDQEGRIVRWDLRANACTEHLIPEPETAIRSVSVSRDGKFMAAVNNKGNLYTWQLENSELTPIKMSKVHDEYVLKCLFSPDSSMLATTSSDGTAKIWRIFGEHGEPTFELDKTLAGHKVRFVSHFGKSLYLIFIL